MFGAAVLRLTTRFRTRELLFRCLRPQLIPSLYLRRRRLVCFGRYDRVLALLDARAPTKVTSHKLQADPECLLWNPHNPAQVGDRTVFPRLSFPGSVGGERERVLCIVGARRPSLPSLAFVRDEQGDVLLLLCHIYLAVEDYAAPGVRFLRHARAVSRRPLQPHQTLVVFADTHAPIRQLVYYTSEVNTPWYCTT